MVEKEDIGDFIYCCEYMETAVLNNCIQCNPHDGQHFIRLYDGTLYHNHWEVPVLFVDYCPFCGKRLEELKCPREM